MLWLLVNWGQELHLPSNPTSSTRYATQSWGPRGSSVKSSVWFNERLLLSLRRYRRNRWDHGLPNFKANAMLLPRQQGWSIQLKTGTTISMGQGSSVVGLERESRMAGAVLMLAHCFSRTSSSGVWSSPKADFDTFRRQFQQNTWRTQKHSPNFNRSKPETRGKTSCSDELFINLLFPLMNVSRHHSLCSFGVLNDLSCLHRRNYL